MTDRELAECALLPCPGCRGSDCRVIGGPGTAGGPQYWAGCMHCRWRTWGNTEAEAIAAWNRRTPSSEGDGRDAERYRWLREQRAPNNRWPHIAQTSRQDFDAVEVPQLFDKRFGDRFGERLDAAIDAAIAAAARSQGTDPPE